MCQVLVIHYIILFIERMSDGEISNKSWPVYKYDRQYIHSFYVWAKRDWYEIQNKMRIDGEYYFYCEYVREKDDESI
jgi:hypothetical protein